MAQALHVPMWKVPDEYERIKDIDQQYLEENHIEINRGNYGKYKDTLAKYKEFAQDFLTRVEKLNSEV